MNIQLDPQDLRQVISEIVTVAIEEIEPIRAQFGAKLLFAEPEAAAILGLTPARLGDLRRTYDAPHQQRGGRVYFNRQDILRIAGMEASPP